MEKLSNDIDELRKVSKMEIENFAISDNERMLMYFLEFPSIAGFPYKIVLIKEDSGNIRIAFRQWDTEYDGKRWSNGIYNLDRLRIMESGRYLSQAETEHFNHLILNLVGEELPKSINDKSALVLDGYNWEFGINYSGINVDYQWKVANTQIELFAPLIEFINTAHNTKM